MELLCIREAAAVRSVVRCAQISSGISEHWVKPCLLKHSTWSQPRPRRACLRRSSGVTSWAINIHLASLVSNPFLYACSCLWLYSVLDLLMQELDPVWCILAQTADF